MRPVGGARGAEIDRRRFLMRSAGAGSAALVGALAAPASVASSAPNAAPAEFDPSDWSSVRSQFELDPSVIHLAAFVLASHPRQVRAAIDRYRSELDGDPYGFVGANEVPLEGEVRAAAAQYLGVSAEEIALTDSTTMGLALVYNGLRLEEGDEIVTTTHDFYSTHEAIRMRQERAGTPVRKVRLYRDPARTSTDEVVASVRRGIGPRTRALAVTWVHSSTGVKLPLRAIADALAEINHTRDESERVLLCVDAVHGFGNQDESPFELGCDFFITGMHKWLFGPRGTGLVWGTTSAWNRVTPTIPTFDPGGISAWITDQPPQGRPPGPFQTPGGFHSFENRWALKEALQFHLDIGRDRVADRTELLATQLKEGLREIDAVRVVTPIDALLSAGIVCFEVDDQPPPAVVDALRYVRRISASVTPYAEQFVRMGPCILNSEEEIDETLRVLRAIL